jgi:catechol 2,3-dioxygenase-like lactoylglutathione lyase family enzyme
MKRMHMHVSVADIDKSIGFYTTMFGAAPSVRKPDYAKWMLDDPRVNFAISTTAALPGLSHVGVQAETAEELTEIATRLKSAGANTFDETNATCCYARSDKAWVSDPSGLRWETFHTHGEATVYGEDIGGVAALADTRAPATACGCGT